MYKLWAIILQNVVANIKGSVSKLLIMLFRVLMTKFTNRNFIAFVLITLDFINTVASMDSLSVIHANLFSYARCSYKHNTRHKFINSSQLAFQN